MLIIYTNTLASFSTSWNETTGGTAEVAQVEGKTDDTYGNKMHYGFIIALPEDPALQGYFIDWVFICDAPASCGLYEEYGDGRISATISSEDGATEFSMGYRSDDGSFISIGDTRTQMEAVWDDEKIENRQCTFYMIIIDQEGNPVSGTLQVRISQTSDFANYIVIQSIRYEAQGNA